ncbi:MAG: hypothetical protein IJV70_06675 [Clostridia bacterium]|nr:hypothetical protein [Clostridia bacterium]
MKKRILSLTLAIIMIAALCPVAVFADNATYNQTLDIAGAKKDVSGPGYQWQNRYDILTLTNITIDTTDTYGLKIPENATIILKGNNYVKASEYAVYCLGKASFEGDGSLTLVAETGIICVSLFTDDIVRFRSGTFDITATDTGIYSENATLTFTGAKVTARSGVNTVLGRNILITAGSLIGNAPIVSKDAVEISAANVEINASSPAVTAVRGIKIGGCDITVGGAPAQAYNGENDLKTVSNVVVKMNGVLFGGKLPAFVDYIVFISLFVIICALVAVPIIIKKRKTARLIAEYERMKAEQAARRKK